jgi:predicted PurR-regulated permease PerM
MSITEVPGSGRSILRLIAGVAGIVIILAGAWAMAYLVNLVLLSLLIVVLFAPMQRQLHARGLPQWAALTIVILVIVVGSLVIFVIAGLAFLSVLPDLPAYQQQFQAQLSQLSSTLAQRGIDMSTFSDALSKAAQTVFNTLVSVASGIVSVLVFWGLAMLIVGFSLFEADSFPRLLQRALGGRTPTYQRVAESLVSVSTYIRITAWINLLIGVFSALLLWLIGIPGPILWGFVSFIFGFVPYIGYWIAIIPPLILAFGQGGMTLVLVVLIGYWLINGILSNVLAPRMYGKGLDLSTVLTLVAVLFWIAVLGPIGGILAIPLTALFKAAILASYGDTVWLATALGDSHAVEETPAKLEVPSQS